MTHEQRDIFGDLIAPPRTDPAPIPVRVEQPRLFEPQIEGQLALADDDEKGGT